MWKAAEQFIGEPRQPGDLMHSSGQCCAPQPGEPAQRVGDYLERGEAWVQALSGVLKNHLDAGPLGSSGKTPRRDLPDLLAGKADPAGTRVDEPRDEPHQCRLAAARLADQPHRLARSDREIDAVHRQ